MNQTSTHILSLLLALTMMGLTYLSAYAEQNDGSPTPLLLNAMRANDSIPLYGSSPNGGFRLSGSFTANSVTQNSAEGLFPLPALPFDHNPELIHDQRVYALLVDGSYDFNYDFGSGLPLHPYLKGGMGMARYDQPDNAGVIALQGGEMVPLFRLGGGVTYRLGDKWNLSLDYNHGVSYIGTDQVFTGRSQLPVDLHVLNMGVRINF